MKFNWLLIAFLGTGLVACRLERMPSEPEKTAESSELLRIGMNSDLLKELRSDNAKLQTNALNSFELFDQYGPDGGPPQFEPELFDIISQLTRSRNERLSQTAAMALRIFAVDASSETLRDAAVTRLVAIASDPFYLWSTRAEALFAFTDDRIHEGTVRETEILQLLAPVLTNFPERRDDLRSYFDHSENPIAAEILKTSVKVELPDAL